MPTGEVTVEHGLFGRSGQLYVWACGICDAFRVVTPEEKNRLRETHVCKLPWREW